MPSIQIPHMTPFPGKRSVLIMDNASIHHCAELLPLVNSAGGILLYTPPYCFECTPLDNGAFGWVKRYLQQHDTCKYSYNRMHMARCAFGLSLLTPRGRATDARAPHDGRVSNRLCAAAARARTSFTKGQTSTRKGTACRSVELTTITPLPDKVTKGQTST